MDEDVEILDLFEDKELSKIKKDNNNKYINKKDEQKHKKNKKKRIIELIFIIISILFIIGCLIFYVPRLIKYYKIYNPDDSESESSLLLSNKITNTEIVYEGNGLYINKGNYIYKGEVSNNYLEYNNILWKIIRVNVDGSIMLISDDYLNLLPFDDNNLEYSKSFINSYLSEYLESNLNKDDLVKQNTCIDTFDSLSDLKCDNSYSNYVSLMDVTTFLNSVVDGKTYLTSDEELVWLSNSGTSFAWHTNGSNVSSSKGNNTYEVRPVITLKAMLTYSSGDGTKENPYKVETNTDLKLGSTVKLGDDKWVVIDTTDNIKLMRLDNLDVTKKFSSESYKYDLSDDTNLAYYLNNDYLNSLSYKDLIIESSYYNGEYKDSITDLKSETVKCKVSIPTMYDIKFDSSIKGYYLNTNKDDNLLVYENPIRTSFCTSERNVRPIITISKDTKFDYSYGIYEVK